MEINLRWDLSLVVEALVVVALVVLVVVKTLAHQNMYSFRLMISYLCPQRCDYCHIFPNQALNKPARMTLDIAKSALDQYFELMRGGYVLVNLYGGEPLSNWEMLQNTLLYGNHLFGHKITWILNTNGTVLSQKRALFLKKNRVDVHISVDGASKINNHHRKFSNGTSAHNKIMAALAILRDCHYKLQLNSCLTDANVNDLKGLVDLATQFNADRIYLATPDYLGEHEQMSHTIVATKIVEADTYAKQNNIALAGPWETALVSSKYTKNKHIPYFVIDTTGLMYLSAYMDRSLGHIDDFQEIIASKNYDTISAEWNTLTEACHTCELYNTCESYLMRMVMYHTGTIEGYENECVLAKELRVKFDDTKYYVENLLGPQETLETADFVFYYSKDGHENLLHHQPLLESAYKALKTQLPPPKSKIEVYFAPKKEDLRHFWHDIPLWVNAFVMLGKLLVVNTDRRIPEDWQDRYIRSMRHELSHIFLKSLEIPIWLLEGLCEFFAKPYHHNNFKKAVHQQKIYTFQELDVFIQYNFLEIDDSPISDNICYQQAHSFVYFLAHLKGIQYLLTCLQSVTAENNVQTQFKHCYGFSLVSAEKKWLKTLKNGFFDTVSYHKLHTTPHLHVISNNGKGLFFNSFLGTSQIFKTDLIILLDFIKKGKTYAEISKRYTFEAFEEVLFDLYQSKLIVYTHTNDDDFFKLESNSVKKGALIKSLRLNLTYGCNMACTYCYAINQNDDNRLMDWNIAKQAIDSFFTLPHPHKSVNIRFFGGEPLLNWTVLQQSLDYIAHIKGTIHVNYFLNTNGTLLTDAMAKVLSRYQVAVIMSLDGIKAIHDQCRILKKTGSAFEQSDHAIDICLKNQCNLSIDTTLGNHNIHHLQDLIDYLIDKSEAFSIPIIPLGLQQMTMGYQDVQNTDVIEQQVEKLITAFKYARDKGMDIGGLVTFPYSRIFNQQQTGTYCSAAGAELSINADGTVYPCAALDMKLGDINDIMTIFSTDAYFNLTQRGIRNIPACQGCEIEVFCAGGCLADAYQDGDIFKATKNCAFEKSFFKAMVKEFML